MNSYLLRNLSGITSASIEKYLLFTGWVRDDSARLHEKTRACLAADVSAGICPTGMARQRKTVERRGGSRDSKRQQACP